MVLGVAIGGVARLVELGGGVFPGWPLRPTPFGADAAVGVCRDAGGDCSEDGFYALSNSRAKRSAVMSISSAGWWPSVTVPFSLS